MAQKGESKFLSVQKLTELSINRSKLWKSFFQNYSVDDDDSEIPLDDIENVWKDDADVDSDKDELAEMEATEPDEEAEEKDFIEELTKCAKSGNSLSETLCHNNLNDNTRHKITKILDETLPVFEAYDRKVKKNGLSKILNSFDGEKINEKVGDSLHSDDLNGMKDFANISPIAKQPTIKKYKANEMSGNHMRGRQHESSSDDSMLSDDTARYIRSSRINHHKISSKHRSVRLPTNTMSIKTYRLVKSRRDALREKYAFSEEEEECDENELEESYQIRRLQHMQRLTMSARSSRHHKHVHHHKILHANESSHESGRQKRIRNLHLMSDRYQLMNESDEQTDDENIHYSKSKYVPYGSCSTSKKKSNGYYTPCSCSMSTRKSAPLHCNSARSVRRVSRLTGRFQMPKIREVMRESECSCCDDETLCADNIHLADLSTEEWIVENLDSPRKIKCSNNAKFSVHLKNKKKEYADNKMLMKYDETPVSHFGRFSSKSVDMSGIHPLSSTVICKKPAKNREQIEKTSTKLSDRYEHELSDNFVPVSKMSAKKASNKMGDGSSALQRTPSARKRQHSNEAKSTGTSDNELAVKLKSIETFKEPAVNKKGKIEKNKPKDKKGDAVDSDSFLKELSFALKESIKSYEEAQKQKKTERKKKLERENTESVKKVTKSKNVIENTIEKTLTTKQYEEDNIKLSEIVKKIIDKNTQKISPSDQEISSVKKVKNSKKVKDCAGEKSLTTECQEIDEENVDILSDTLEKSVQNITVIKNPQKIILSDQDISPEKGVENSKMDKSITRKKNSNELNIINLSDSPHPTVPKTPLKMPRKSISSSKDNDNSRQSTSTRTSDFGKQSGKCKSPKNIVIYNPSIRELVESESLKNGHFELTREHLSKFIGEELAMKFFKYYIGRRHFDDGSTLLFCPPSANNDDTESDDDELELFGKYGRIIVSR